MYAGKIAVKSLNELLQLVQKAEASEGLKLIEKHRSSLDAASQQCIDGVAGYLRTKLPQTAHDASAMVQVMKSNTISKIKGIFKPIKNSSLLDGANMKPQLREDSTMLKDNLLENPIVFIHPQGKNTLLNQIRTRVVDGLDCKSYDDRFMSAVQRLVDLKVIDDSTLVFFHTGHNIPMAHQLMKNKSLGQVSGVLDIGKDCYPELTPKTEKIIRDVLTGNESKTGLQADAIAHIKRELVPFKDRIMPAAPHEESFLNTYKRNFKEYTGRYVDQNHTYSDVLKSETTGKGAKFIGIDFHRSANYDTSKLPSAEELQKAGIKKVVFLDENIPKDIFSARELDRLYEPFTSSHMSKATELIDKTGESLLKKDVDTAFSTVDQLDNLLKPGDLQKKLIQPTPEQVETANQLVQSGKFGYSPAGVTRADVEGYLEGLKKEMPVIIEGSDVLKLEIFPHQRLRQIIPQSVEAEREQHNDINRFTELLKFIDRQ